MAERCEECGGLLRPGSVCPCAIKRDRLVRVLPDGHMYITHRAAVAAGAVAVLERMNNYWRPDAERDIWIGPKEGEGADG